MANFLLRNLKSTTRSLVLLRSSVPKAGAKRFASTIQIVNNARLLGTTSTNRLGLDPFRSNLHQTQQCASLSTSAGPRINGTVKRWNGDKDYGFLTPDDNQQDVHSTKVTLALNIFTERRKALEILQGERRKALEILQGKAKGRVLPNDSSQINPNTDYFLTPIVDMDTIVSHLETLRGHHLFVRSSVGSGKSSLLALLALNPQCALLTCSEATMVTESIWQHMCERTTCEGQLLCEPSGNHTKLDFLAQLEGKMLLVDEAHLLFEHGDVLQALVKEQGNFFVLFTSSGTAHQLAQNLTPGKVNLPTPVIITNKKFLALHFTEEEVGDLYDLYSDNALTAPFRDRVVHLLYVMYKGHRLLTISTLSAIQKHYQDMFTEITMKSTPDAGLRAMFRVLMLFLSNEIGSLSKCRAAIINSQFQHAHNLIFSCNKLLSEGVLSSVIWPDRIGGLIVRNAVEPVTEAEEEYGWTNPFVARWFHDQKYAIQPVVEDRSALSVVLFGIAYLSIPEFFSLTPRTSQGALQFLQMPFEEQFQRGWGEALKGLPGCLVKSEAVFCEKSNDFVTRDAENPLFKDRNGRIDFVLEVSDRICSVEMVVIGHPVKSPTTDMQENIKEGNENNIREHVERYDSKRGKTTYQQALDHGSAILLVFAHPEAAPQALSQVSKCLTDLQHPNKKNLSALVLSMDSVFSYEAVLVSSSSSSSSSSSCGSPSPPLGLSPLQLASSSVPTATYLGPIYSLLCAQRLSSCGTKLERNQRFPTLVEVAESIEGLDAARATFVDEKTFWNTCGEKPLVEELDEAIQSARVVCWVQQLDTTLQRTGRAFKVVCQVSDIDSLTDAIKVKKSNTFEYVDADELRIYKMTSDEKWELVEDPEQPLKANTSKRPYGVRPSTE